MPAKLSEAQIQKQIIDWLKLKCIFHWRNNSGAMFSIYKGKKRFMRFGAVGSPDIFAIFRGKLYGIEVKGPNGKPSQEQLNFGAKLVSEDCGYLVAWKLEDVTTVLDT